MYKKTKVTLKRKALVDELHTDEYDNHDHQISNNFILRISYSSLTGTWGSTIGNIVQNFALNHLVKRPKFYVLVDGSEDFDSVPCNIGKNDLFAILCSCTKGNDLYLTKGQPQSVESHHICVDGTSSKLFEYDGTKDLTIRWQQISRVEYTSRPSSKDDTSDGSLNLSVCPSANSADIMSTLYALEPAFDHAIKLFDENLPADIQNKQLLSHVLVDCPPHIIECLSMENINTVEDILRTKEEGLYLLPSLSMEDIKILTVLLRHHNIFLPQETSVN